MIKLKVIVAVGILYILLIVAVIFVSGNGESISEKRVDEELLCLFIASFFDNK